MREIKKFGILAILGLAILFLFWNSSAFQSTGLSSQCPDCKEISGQTDPNHTYILPIALLLVAIVGAHSLSHLSSKITVKRCLMFAMVVSALLFAVVFGFSIVSPTGAATLTVQRLSSIIAAFSVIGIFIIGAYEIISHQEDKHEWSDDKGW